MPEGDEGKRAVDTAEFLVDQYNAIGCHGLVVGDRDAVLGVKRLAALRKRAKFPFLTANLVDSTTGKPVFESHALYEVGGVKVGAFGLTMESTDDRLSPDGTPPPWKVLDAVETAKAEVAALRAQGATVVLALAHLSEGEMTELAEKVDGLTAILGGNGVRLLQHPDLVRGVFLTEAFSKGKYVSEMVFHVWKGHEGDAAFVDRFRKQGLMRELGQLESRITSYERILEKKIEEEKAAQAASTPGEAGKPGTPGASASPAPPLARGAVSSDFYRQQLVKMQTEKAALDLALEDAGDIDMTKNFISYEMLAVKQDIEDDKGIFAKVETFRKKWPKDPGSH